MDNGKKYQAFGGGKAWVVSKYTKNKAVCQKFIDYLTSDKNQEKLYKDIQEVPANQNARKYAVKNGTELSKASNLLLQIRCLTFRKWPKFGQVLKTW